MWKLRFGLLLVALLTFSATFIPVLLEPAQGQAVCQTMLKAQAVGDPCDKMLQISAHQFYYRVEGETAPQLVNQIRHLGPLWRDGNRYEAMHTWQLNQTYEVSEMGDRCVLSNPQIEVETVITLPQWQPPTDAAATLVIRWGKYTTALKKHEDGHQTIALESGAEILQTLKAFPSYASCSELQTLAKAAVEAVIERCNQSQIEYDRQTQHGLAQGASYVRWLM